MQLLLLLVLLLLLSSKHDMTASHHNELERKSHCSMYVYYIFGKVTLPGTLLENVSTENYTIKRSDIAWNPNIINHKCRTVILLTNNDMSDSPLSATRSGT